jgi:hypothetical protein
MREELRDFDDRVTDRLLQPSTLPESVERIARLKNADVLNFVTRYLKKHGEQLVPTPQSGVYQLAVPQHLLGRQPNLSAHYRATFDQETANIAIDADYIAHGHPFLMAAASDCLQLGHTACLRVLFSRADRRLHGYDHLAGCRGVWANFKITFSSYDIEQALVSVFVTDQEMEIGDFSSRLLYYPLEEAPAVALQLEGVQDCLAKALSRETQTKRQALELLNREVFEEETAKIDTYFEDALMEFEDQEQNLLRQMERTQAKRQKARVFEERKALREEYERLKEEYFKVQRQNFQRRHAKNEERESKVRNLEEKMQPDIQVSWINAALVEIE